MPRIQRDVGRRRRRYSAGDPADDSDTGSHPTLLSIALLGHGGPNSVRAARSTGRMRARILVGGHSGCPSTAVDPAVDRAARPAEQLSTRPSDRLRSGQSSPSDTDLISPLVSPQPGPSRQLGAADAASRQLGPGWCQLQPNPPRSVVLYTQGRESGGSGFETRSGVIPQASLLKCGHNPLVD
jgi:hypothetical protein